MRRLLALLAAALLSAAAHAQSSNLAKSLPPLAEQIANGARISYASNGTPLAGMARSYAMGPITGNVVVSEAGLLATPGGSAALTVSRGLGWSAVAAAAAAGYAGFEAGAIARHLTGNDASITIGPTRCTTSATGWQCDAGADPNVTVNKVYTAGANAWGTADQGHGSSAASACGNAASKNSKTTGIAPNTTNTAYSVVSSSETTCMLKLDLTNCSASGCTTDHGSAFNAGMKSANETTTDCPAYTDALNPAWSGGAGSSPDPDGKCKTGRYSGAPPSTVAPRIEAYGNKGDAPAVVQDLVEKGATIPVADPLSITGPAAKAQPTTTTTTTTAAGTTTTTNTATYNYTYAGDTITWQVTNNTSTTNPDGTTTNTSTTTNDTPAADDPCTTYPDRAGCRQMGDPPGAENVPSQSINVSVTPSGGFGADNGSCPALVSTVSVGMVNVYGLFCTYASGIRFAVIGVAWIIGALIFVGRVE